jgi:polar amino acid transport system permease protein
VTRAILHGPGALASGGEAPAHAAGGISAPRDGAIGERSGRTDGTAEPKTPPLVPRRHPWRVVVGGVALLFLAYLVVSIATNDGFQWDVVGRYFTAPIILWGLLTTIKLTIVTIILGFLFGTLLAMARLSKNPVLQGLSWGYVWFFRSVPLLVLILFTFNIAYLIPTIAIGLPFSAPFVSLSTNQVITPLGAGLLALTLNESAYAAEIVRGGILGVDQGQFEAAAALGMSRRRTMLRIIIPQAMRSIIPTAGNQLIGLLRGTSMVSVIAVGDLLYSAQTIYNRTFQVVPLLVVATLWYVVVTTLLSWGQYYVERHFARGALRQMPPTARQWLRSKWRGLASATAPVAPEAEK